MAQKVVGYVKLQIPAGKATPAPPVGPALGQHGVNIAAFTKEFNERTKNDLAKFSQVLKNNTDCQVDIQGYTDSTGNDGINLPLSENRAKAVYNYLISCGVKASQFKNVAGYGSSNPVGDNSTKAGQQANRRVEVYLYASQAMVDKANNGTLN